MPALRIAIYTMAKNEAIHVKRFAETTRGADVVVVTDTGSTDGTPDLLRDAGIEVYSGRIVPWRFDTATNVALAHVPEDVDICIKLDLDEVLYHPESWRSAVERAWQEGVSRLRYWYTWSWHVPGQVPAVKFLTENIHARSGFIWRHPGHAGLYSNERSKSAVTDLEIHHYMVTKGRPNYLSLLQLAVHEHKCPRTLYYLGREYYFRQIHDNAIATLQEYLHHPEANWKAQRAEAMRMIALTHQRQQRADQCLAFLFQAIAECPGVRDLWYEVMKFFHQTGDWGGGLWAGRKALAITMRHGEYTAHGGEAWFDKPYELASECAAKFGQITEAQQLAAEALRINPNNDRVLRLSA